MSVFSELKRICPPLASPACDALETINDNPLHSLENIERHVTYLTQTILAFEGLAEPAAGTQVARLNVLNNRGLLPSALLPFFYALAGKDHGGHKDTAATRMRAHLHLKLAVHLTAWFNKSYGPYLPPTATAFKTVEELFQVLRAQPPDDSIRRAARKVAMRRAATMTLAEDETRVIIDYQLRSAGWQADTASYAIPWAPVPKKASTRPSPNGPPRLVRLTMPSLRVSISSVWLKPRRWARMSWPTLHKASAMHAISQLDGEARFIAGPWDDFKVPFLFSTNGRPYLEQLKEKSGIWFLDVRDPTNHPRPLQGWYSAEELRGAPRAGYSRSPGQTGPGTHGLPGASRLPGKGHSARSRPPSMKGQTTLLVAMATGTGKTRLAIGLIYRLIKIGTVPSHPFCGGPERPGRAGR